MEVVSNPGMDLTPWLMFPGAWLSSLMLQMIDKPIVCWEAKKSENL